MHSRGRTRPVRAIRSLAWLVSLVAIYLSLFGVGSENRSITAVGVGLAVIAVAGRITAEVLARRRTWVRGTAYVLNVSEPPTSAYGSCQLELALDASGLPAARVKVWEPRVALAKWPVPGAMLPIEVAESDVNRVRIPWREVLAAHDPSPSYGSSS